MHPNTQHMTPPNTDPELDADEVATEEPKSHIPPVAQKSSKFGAPQFQNGSKFGKGNHNPQLKQRPGRAAARGR